MREWPERAGLKVRAVRPGALRMRGRRRAAWGAGGMHRRCLARPCFARPAASAGVIVVRCGSPLRVRGCLRADSGRRAGPVAALAWCWDPGSLPLGGIQEVELLEWVFDSVPGTGRTARRRSGGRASRVGVRFGAGNGVAPLGGVQEGELLGARRGCADRGEASPGAGSGDSPPRGGVQESELLGASRCSTRCRICGLLRSVRP